MHGQLQARLVSLKHEFETGQTQLRELERQQAYLHETLLRISGAIQVLEELVATPGKDGKTPPVDVENAVVKSN